MDFYRFGQVGIGMGFVGVAGEYYTFLNGDNSGVILSGFVALIGILITLVAAVKENNSLVKDSFFQQGVDNPVSGCYGSGVARYLDN